MKYDLINNIGCNRKAAARIRANSSFKAVAEVSCSRARFPDEFWTDFPLCPGPDQESVDGVGEDARTLLAGEMAGAGQRDQLRVVEKAL
jgi:hypothetical protein